MIAIAMPRATAAFAALSMIGAASFAACDGTGEGGITEPDDTVALAVETVATGLQSPVHLSAPAGDTRLFVVEQTGRVRIIDDGQLLSTPFLDIRDSVAAGGERGLLSIAFHPAYATNGRFYVNYTGVDGDTRVEEYAVSSDPDVADRGSVRRLLLVRQPQPNHNGGLVAFGPDGYLWVGMGDGGGGGDPGGNGQDPSTLLGTVLRIDVDTGSPYGIPSDNPFASGGVGAPEVWAWGLRNPWRFAFDRPAGDLYIADVGQNAWEEVNVQRTDAAGVNYGWNVMEGMHCYAAATCDQSGLTLPVLEYGHADGCSITGGYVYRGGAIPDLVGHYLYADYCEGWVRSFRYDNGDAVDRRQLELGSIGRVLSFGEDSAGELYILSAGGNVYRLVPGT